MKRLRFKLRLTAAALLGFVSALMRRLRRGRTRPGWTWREEFFVGVSRAVLLAAARDVELMSPRRTGLKLPLGRAARRALIVDDVELGGVRAERYCPKGGSSGTIVYFHGGGFMTGSVETERGPASQNAIASNCETFSVEYRLAPKHPYPAALDDAVAAYRAVIARGADPTTTIFFGGSAGACLALAALLQIRELGLPQPAGAVLLWPYADFTFSGESIQRNAEVDMLPVRDLAHVWGPAYCGEANPEDPLVSPAFADLSGLPPLLIIAGGAESLLSCAERIAGNARRAGIETQFTVYPHKVHGWLILSSLPASIDAVDEINAWIARRLESS